MTMKSVILSADGDRVLYSVPDAVGENLDRFCMEFVYWMQRTPAGKKYWVGRGWMYDQEDFIDWLNEVRFPEEASRKLAVLGDWNSELPEEYSSIPYFNF